MIFKGSGTAIITPFDSEGVNFQTFRQLIDYQLDNGANALIVLGTTGEPCTMTENERTQVIEFAVDYVNGKIPVIVGVGTNNTATSIKYAKTAASIGADGLLVVTPYYNKCTQKGLVRHYYAIADSADLPVIVYNVPSRTGLNVLPQTYLELSKHPNITAIKEACGNIEQISKTAALVNDKMAIYSGDDACILPILALGGMGVISVVSNAVPEIVSNLCASFFEGDLKTARELQFKLLPLINVLFSEVSPIPVKAAMNLLGFDCGAPRLPLTESENKEQILKELKRLIPNL
ncbi:MAG: 4-hydroxy-tetrahydrodipicolinate synthase [Clostridiales bacterium]|jgi:4-hydroxy-tetrahydrodipicolinate synthase|nr:4-hydroxy-tetrahydrodipicolinate synthase [Clostridiales bacterium]